MSEIAKHSIFAEKIEVLKIIVRSGGELRRNLYLRDGTLISGSNEINGEIVSVGFDDIIHVAPRVGDGTRGEPVRYIHSFFELDGHFISEHSDGINWSFSGGFAN